MTRPKRAETRRERRDRVALRAIRERRAQARVSVSRGDLYVIPGHEDEPYAVYSVNGRRVVLQNTKQRGFLVFSEPFGEGNPLLGYWVRRR